MGWRAGLLILLLILAPAVPAPGQPAPTQPVPGQPTKPPVPEATTGLPDYPALVGPWRRDRIIDYAARTGDPGLGTGANYLPEDGQGGVASVYVYDRGRRDLVDGADSPAVAQEMDLAIREIEMLGPQRHYRMAGRQAMAPVTGPGGRALMRCETIVLAFEAEAPRRSIACVGVAGGRFVKLRLTRPGAAPGDPEDLARAFAREILDRLALGGMAKG